MGSTNNTASTVELPPDVDHHSTSAFARSWEAYDALTAEDGWTETRRFDPETGAPHQWKRGEIRGHAITVHAPRGPRPNGATLDRDDNRAVSEPELMQGYGLAVHADELRRRRTPHALKRDLGL